jgi:hypothetical protein
MTDPSCLTYRPVAIFTSLPRLSGTLLSIGEVGILECLIELPLHRSTAMSLARPARPPVPAARVGATHAYSSIHCPAALSTGLRRFREIDLAPCGTPWLPPGAYPHGHEPKLGGPRCRLGTRQAPRFARLGPAPVDGCGPFCLLHISASSEFAYAAVIGETLRAHLGAQPHFCPARSTSCSRGSSCLRRSSGPMIARGERGSNAVLASA